MLSGGDTGIASEFERGQGTGARPQPLALTADVGTQREYPVDALGPLLAAATRAGAQMAFVPLSMAAQSCLAACSLAVQGHFDVRLPTGQSRPTTLHLVSVAESGDRKSTIDTQMMKPIADYQNELEEELHVQRAKVAIEQNAWDESKKQTTSVYKSKGHEALAEAYTALGPRPADPADPTLVIRSGTTQALLKRFVVSRPSLGLMSDEGGSWLGGYGMTEDNRLHTIAVLSDFWDGATIQINTASEGFTPLRGRRLAFHLMLQPILSGRLLGSAEAQGQGFLSRLLVSHCPSLAGTRFVDPENPRAQDVDLIRQMDAFRERLGAIVRAPLPVNVDNGALSPRLLTMTPEAEKMWWAFYNQLERRLAPEGDLCTVKGFVGKLPEQAARIAATITGVERGYHAREIDAATLARGIQLSEFYLSEAVRLFGRAAPSTEMVDAQDLSNWLRDVWKENLISVTAITQNGPNRLRQGATFIKRLIEILVENEHLSPPMPNGGPVAGTHARKAWRVIVGRA